MWYLAIFVMKISADQLLEDSTVYDISFKACFPLMDCRLGVCKVLCFGSLLNQKTVFSMLFTPCESEVADFAMFGSVVKTTWFFSRSMRCFKSKFIFTKPWGNWQLIHHRLSNGVLRPWGFKIACFFYLTIKPGRRRQGVNCRVCRGSLVAVTPLPT